MAFRFCKPDMSIADRQRVKDWLRTKGWKVTPIYCRSAMSPVGCDVVFAVEVTPADWPKVHQRTDFWFKEAMSFGEKGEC